MSKKYDLIIVGAGPAGLMAAKTAAVDGLKVVVVERKKNITEINRTCSQIFYIRKRDPTKKGFLSDGYIDPVAIEFGFDTTKFVFPVPGFSLEYKGPLKPYYNWMEVSPSKYLIYTRRKVLWGFYFPKEVFLTELLSSAQKAGAEIWPQNSALAIENIPDGVKVVVRGTRGEQTLEARKAIAADGMESKMVKSLGLNKNRQIFTSMKMVSYWLEGVETDLPPFSWANFCIPSINRLLLIFFGQLAAGDHAHLISGSKEVLQKFMTHPNFAPWFDHARVVKKTAFTGNVRTPIRNPVEDNVVIVGDAGAPVETWIQGAIASAYMAVKAIEKELNGQKGFSGYMEWWQKAFYFNKPDYFSWVVKQFALANVWTDDEEVDDIYKLLQDINKEKEGYPLTLIDENPELIKKRRPEFYERLQKAYKEAEKTLLKQTN